MNDECDAVYLEIDRRKTYVSVYYVIECLRLDWKPYARPKYAPYGVGFTKAMRFKSLRDAENAFTHWIGEYRVRQVVVEETIQ